MTHTSYSTGNRRVRNLEQTGFVRKVEVKERPGGLTNLYELRPKAYLAEFLSTTNLNTLLDGLNDALSETLLASLMEASAFVVKETPARG